MEDILLEPVTYYKNLKGKNIRNIICNWLGQLMNIKQEDIDFINEINNNIHNASLVIDDIEDNSLLRRNEPCAHIKYGIPISLNAGYYAIFKSLREITYHFSQTTINKIIEYLFYIHEGQGMDIYYMQNKIIPSLEEYEKMMIYKTGYTLIMNLELLMDKSTNIIMKKNVDKLKKILVTFSLFFQIRDDYINLTDLGYWHSKGFCQDFDEGKISYLITYFKTMSDKNIIDMMNDKTKEGKIRILELFCNHGLFDIVYNKLVELKEQILNEMNLSIIFDELPFHKFDFNHVYKI